MAQTEGSTKKGGRPPGTGPRQREALEAANAVGEKVQSEVAKLRADVAAALDGFPVLVAGLTKRLAECAAWMERCEAVAIRIGTGGGHDIAVLAERLGDARELLREFAENTRAQARAVEATQRSCDAHSTSIAEAAAAMIAEVRTQAARADDAARARHAEELAAIRKAEAAGRRAEAGVLVALARTERAVLGNIRTVEANSVARHTELKAELASRGEAARPPNPSPRDDEAKRKAAAERALGGQFVIRERRDAATHPEQFTIGRYIFDGGLRVDVHADDSCCVWVGSFLAVRKRAGWSPSDLAEVADRAVTAVARVRRTNRRVAPALRAVR